MAGSGVSKTLDEIGLNATFGAPFTSTNINGALMAVFYSPFNTLESDGPKSSSGFWEKILCDIGTSGPARFRHNYVYCML